MSRFILEDRYILGVGIMDEEHRRLIHIMEDLRHSISLGKGRQVIASVLHNLLDYTKTHFVDEESLMREHTYPEFEFHKRIHDQFVTEVVQATKLYLEGRAIPTKRIKEMLFDWLLQHIMENDKKLAQYLNKKGIQ